MESTSQTEHVAKGVTEFAGPALSIVSDYIRQASLEFVLRMPKPRVPTLDEYLDMADRVYRWLTEGKR